MAYPNTGTTLSSNIATGLSTQIVIQVELPNGGVIDVGAVKSITEEQTRQLARITEIGTDGVIEIVPNRATEFSLNLERTVFDGLSLTEAFGRGFRNIQSQRFPFNLQMIDVSGGAVDSNGVVDKNSVVITTYSNCWFTRTSTPFRTDDYVIMQSANVWCEGIFSSRAGKPVAMSQAASGGRSVLTANQIDPIEGAADSRHRLGSLDFGGLIRSAGIGGITKNLL